MRRSIFARVKFFSRLFTALNLLPSIATLASVLGRPYFASACFFQSFQARAKSEGAVSLAARSSAEPPPSTVGRGIGDESRLAVVRHFQLMALAELARVLDCIVRRRNSRLKNPALRASSVR